MAWAYMNHGSSPLIEGVQSLTLVTESEFYPGWTYLNAMINLWSLLISWVCQNFHQHIWDHSCLLDVYWSFHNWIVVHWRIPNNFFFYSYFSNHWLFSNDFLNLISQWKMWKVFHEKLNRLTYKMYREHLILLSFLERVLLFKALCVMLRVHTRIVLSDHLSMCWECCLSVRLVFIWPYCCLFFFELWILIALFLFPPI